MVCGLKGGLSSLAVLPFAGANLYWSWGCAQGSGDEILDEPTALLSVAGETGRQAGKPVITMKCGRSCNREQLLGWTSFLT